MVGVSEVSFQPGLSRAARSGPSSAHHLRTIIPTFIKAFMLFPLSWTPVPSSIVKPREHWNISRALEAPYSRTSLIVFILIVSVRKQ